MMNTTTPGHASDAAQEHGEPVGALLVLALSVTVTPAAAGDVKLLKQPSTFPLVISEPGSYRLSGNLTAPANTNGIDITANNVTIDLALALGAVEMHPRDVDASRGEAECAGSSHAAGGAENQGPTPSRLWLHE